MNRRDRVSVWSSLHLTCSAYAATPLPMVVKTAILTMCLILWLQNALHTLEDIKQSAGRQSLVERLHRDARSRQLQRHPSPRGTAPFPFDKRVSFGILSILMLGHHRHRSRQTTAGVLGRGNLCSTLSLCSTVILLCYIH